MDRSQRRILRLRNHVLRHDEQEDIKELAEELADAGNLELEDLTVPELRDEAKAKGIVGYSNMKKEELIESIEGV